MTIREALFLIEAKVYNWIKSLIAFLPNFLVAILIVFVFAFVSRYMQKIVSRLMSRAIENSSLVLLTSGIIRLAVMATGIFVALSVLELDKAVTSLLAGAGIIGLALGFAFQDLTANFLSGTFIAIQQPIRVGDIIETNGYFGQVKAINLRSTILDNFGGQEIEIPSKDIFQKPIVNFSTSGERRLELNAGISYTDDLLKAEVVAIEAIRKLPFLMDTKAVEFHYQSFTTGSITFLIWFWIDPQTVMPHVATSEAIKALRKAFTENQLTLKL